MSTFDKPLAYLQDMIGGEAPKEGADSAAPLRVRVEVQGFPASTKGLKPGNYTLGASPDCDLIIPEAPNDEVALLHVRAASEGAHELVALARGLIVNGAPLAQQQRMNITGETTLKVGPTRIVLSPKISGLQRAAQTFQQVRVPQSYTTPLALLLVAFVLGMVAWFSSGSSSRDYVYTAPTRPTGTVMTGLPLTTAEEVERELNRLFSAADLSAQISAKASGREVIVDGAVNTQEERRLTEILQSVSKRSRVDIRTKVRPDPSTLVSSIAGVGLSPTRYIVLRDGDKFRVGDLMPNGWRVEEIETTRVIVARDGLRETLDLLQK